MFLGDTIHPTADINVCTGWRRRKRLRVGAVRDDILEMVRLALFLKEVWYLDREMEGWASRWVEGQ